MLRSYFKMAFRHLIKDRQFTLLNLVGLSIGLACTLLIYLWVSDELQMDKSFANDSQVFQVMKNSGENGNSIQTYEWTPGPLAVALAKEMPEVEYAVTVVSEDVSGTGVGSGNGVISSGNKRIRAAERYAGKDYFNIFPYTFLYGDKNQVLSDRFDVVISDLLALKLFNSTDNIVGKKIEWNKKILSGQVLEKTYRITGVFKKPVYHSSAQFDLVFALDSYRAEVPSLDDWAVGFPDTYILLKKNADIAGFKNKLSGFLQKKTKDSSQSLFVRRSSDKYLFGRYENGVQAGGRIGYVRLFSLVALFVLIIGCVNFMNLSTAKASGRMKEIGVKKVIGARRGSLALQFLGESVFMSLLALVIALLLVSLFLPDFGIMTGKNLQFPTNPAFVLSALGITLFTGLVAGSYPAIYLSGFNPLKALKGKGVGSISELLVRKGLVIFQFVISAILIVSVWVVYKQMQFVQSVNLGFNKDNTIVFKKEGIVNKGGIHSFLQEIRRIPGVVRAGNSASDLIINYTGTSLEWPEKKADDKTEFKYLFVGDHYIETLGIPVKEGRAFADPSDTASIILNEAAVKAMEIKNPVGRTITQWGQKKEIIGVVNDFHFESLYEKIKPCFFILTPDAENITVRIGGGKEKETIERIRQFYQKYNPGYPFEFRFLDAGYQVLYESENRVSALTWWFAGMAIAISCLGLFGLAAFTAQKRQKEIGIRKVVGASMRHVVIMLSMDFLKLVLIAIIVAFPLAWWATQHWLNDFAYRIHTGILVYLISGGLIILVTLITISFQAINAALANPMKSLRTE